MQEIDKNLQNETINEKAPTVNTVPISMFEKQNQNSEVKGGNFLEKGIRKAVRFIARISGQPEPQPWNTSNQNNQLWEQQEYNISSPQVAQNPEVAQNPQMVQNPEVAQNPQMVQNPEVAQTPQMVQNPEVAQNPQSNVEVQTETNFFNKLIASTQTLLNKASSFADNASQKTIGFAQKVAQVPWKIGEKTSNVLGKGIAIWENIKNKTTSTLDKWINAGKQIQDNLVENVSNLPKTPIGAISNIWKWAVSTTTDAAKSIGGWIKKIWEKTLDTTKNIGSSLKDGVENVSQKIETEISGPKEKKDTFLGKITTKGEKILEKTKDIGTKTIENTKNTINDPIGALDSFAGSGVASPIQSETPIQSDAPIQSETPIQSDAPIQSETPIQSDAPIQSETPA